MNLLRLLVLFLVINVLVPMPTVSSHPAIDVVENLHKTLLNVMKEGNRIGFKGRNDQLAPVITVSFDMPFIANQEWADIGRLLITNKNQNLSRPSAS
jgi:hypothetical protein